MPQTDELPLTEVHLWYVEFDDIADEQLVARYAGLLNEEETERRNRFVFERDRRAYAISHALLRTTLSHYSDVPPERWSFSFNNYGRPEVDQPAEQRGLRFNLSHTRGAALVGVVREFDLGVDVETVDRNAACVELVDRYFSTREVADLRQHPAEKQRDAFFDYWTLKEAYIKARGMGLAIPLDRFTYLLKPERPIEIAFAADWQDDPAVWQFLKFRPSPRFQTAAAVRRGTAASLRFVWRRTIPLLHIGEPIVLPT